MRGAHHLDAAAACRPSPLIGQGIARYRGREPHRQPHPRVYPRAIAQFGRETRGENRAIFKFHHSDFLYFRPMNKPTSRQCFLAAVAEAARRAIKKRGTRGLNISPASLRALDVARSSDRTRGVRAARRAPRCDKIRTNGLPCRAPALRGATRCRWHGGLRQVVNHPGNIRRWLSGKYARQDRIRAAHRAWRDAPRENRDLVLSIVPEDRQRDILLLTEGLAALDAGFFDGGRAWRRFLGLVQCSAYRRGWVARS
jgi:glucans biosynthesis protein